MKKIGTLAAVLALCVVSAGTAQAQRFGAALSWGSDTDLGVAPRVEFPLTNMLSKSGALSKAFFIGEFTWFFPDCGGASGVDCSYWELNPGLAVPFTVSNPKIAPYLGAGLNIAHASASSGGFTASDTQTGLNALGGLKFGLGSMDAFTEARLELSGGEQLVLSFGLLFGGAKK